MGRQTIELKRIWALLVGATGITVLLYLPTLWYGFVWDDNHLIVSNRFLETTNPFQLFSRGFWYNPDRGENEGDMSYYRPLTNLAFYLERKEFELNPAGYHLTSLLLHGAVVFLLGLILYELFRSSLAAALGSLGYGIAPAQNCVVTFIANRTYLLAGLFLLLSLLALLLGRKQTANHRGPGLLALLRLPEQLRRILLPVIYGSSFLLALLALEAPLVFTVLAAGWLITQRRNYRAIGYWAAATLVPLIIYFLLRSVVAGIPMRTGSVVHWAMAEPLRVINTFGLHSLLFFIPFGQKVIYTVGPEFTGFSGYTVIGLIILIAPLLLIILRPNARRHYLLGYSWLVVFLLPFANLLFLGPAGRMLYLASPGLVIITVAALQELKPAKPAIQRLLAVGLAAYGIALIGQLMVRNPVWRNELTLSRAMANEAPDSPGAHLNLGAELAKQGRMAEAIEHYRLSIAADSNYLPPRNRLAFALLEQGDYAGAIEQFAAVVRIDPSADAYNNLALTLKRAGLIDSAIRCYQAGLRLAPASDTLLNNLGRAYLDKGDIPRAIALFEQLLARSPNFTPARENLREGYLLLRRRQDSLTYDANQ